MLGLELETIMDIEHDRVRIAFLGVGESKVELVQPTDDTTGVARFLAVEGGGLPPRLLRGPQPDRDAAAPRDGRARADRHGPAPRCRGAGRVHPSALVPRRARRADRGARRAGLAALGFALSYPRAASIVDRRRPGGRPMIISTTPTLEGRPIAEYRGLVDRRGDPRREHLQGPVRRHPRHRRRALGRLRAGAATRPARSRSRR